jgi:anti-sigma-K factor RskA
MADELHLLTGAYAIDALNPEERSAFEVHLVACDDCTTEVAELHATAAKLGIAVSEIAPTALREQVVRRASTIRQLPPAIALRSTSRRSATRNIAMLAVAAAVLSVALGGLGSFAWSQHIANRNLSAEAARVSAVLTAPDSATASVAVATGGRATIVVSRQLDTAAFVGSGLTQTPKGRVYELWFIDAAGTPRPAGVFQPTASGSTTVRLTGDMGSASVIAVTVEASGGSLKPSTTPVVVLHVPTV